MKRCRWKTDEVVAKGTELKPTILQYRTELDPRVGAGTIEEYVANLLALRDHHRGTANSQVDKKAATELQLQLMRDASGFLSARRTAIRKEFVDDPALQRSFGVGRRLAPNSISSVTSAIDLFVSAAKAHPSEAQLAGVVPEDITRLEKTLRELDSGEENQEGAKAGAKASTADRNVVQLKVEAAMVKFVTAAELAFPDRPEVLALFRSALPSSRSRKARKNKPNETP